MAGRLNTAMAFCEFSFSIAVPASNWIALVATSLKKSQDDLPNVKEASEQMEKLNTYY